MSTPCRERSTTNSDAHHEKWHPFTEHDTNLLLSAAKF
jgi:hypothetical protein